MFTNVFLHMFRSTGSVSSAEPAWYIAWWHSVTQWGTGVHGPKDSALSNAVFTVLEGHKSQTSFSSKVGVRTIQRGFIRWVGAYHNGFLLGWFVYLFVYYRTHFLIVVRVTRCAPAIDPSERDAASSIVGSHSSSRSLVSFIPKKNNSAKQNIKHNVNQNRFPARDLVAQPSDALRYSQ